MKHFTSLLFSWLLALSLTVYGPAGAAASAGSGAFMTMEICADGVLKVMRIDIDAAPIEPSHECPDCRVCCDAPSALAPLGGASLKTAYAAQSIGGLAPLEIPYTQNRNTRPMPRGPPAVPFILPNTPEQNLSNQGRDGAKIRGDGRPLLKDAIA